MNDFRIFWTNQARLTKAVITTAILAAIITPIFIVMFLKSDSFEPLYSDLTEQDAARVIAKLDALKIDYKLEGGGQAILVEKSNVDSIRLKMVNEGVLTGSSIGYEIFDSLGYGVSDYAQKIHYQRAMQGELIRSIMMLDSVKAARVHLVLPEDKLFSKNPQKAKASVVLTVKPGIVLDSEQIIGIQTLVASSVKGLDPEGVVINDEHGILLSTAVNSDRNLPSSLIDEKTRLERGLTYKCEQILNHVFGPGQSIVNVNVTLTASEVNEVKESIVTSGRSDGEGVLVKRKKSITKKTEVEKNSRNQELATVQETNEDVYQTGKLVETKTRMPGEIAKISVSALLPENATLNQIDSIRELLAATVGIDLKRGDVIAVEKLAHFYSEESGIEEVNVLAVDADSQTQELVVGRTFIEELSEYKFWILGLLSAIFLIIFAFNKNRNEFSLGVSEREQLLLEIQGWLDENESIQEVKS